MRRLLLVIILLFLLVAQQTYAVGPGAIGASASSCDPLAIEVVFVGVHEGDPNVDDIGAIDLYDGDGTLVYHATFALPANTNVSVHNFTANQFITLPQANPMRVVISDVDTGSIAWDYPFTIPCVTRTVDNPGFAYASDGIRIALNQEADERYGFSLYGVDLDGETGFPVITMTADDLAALPDEVEENTLIAAGEETTYWGEVSLYLLTTGELQVNVGPDAEGKVRVTIYDGIPPTRVYGYEFNVLEAPTP